MKMKSAFAAVCVLAMLGGCSTSKILNPVSPQGVKAASFDADSQKGVIYIYRSRTSDFGGFELNVKFNGENVPVLPACFKRVELQPGVVKVEGTHPDLFATQQEITIPLKAGDVKVYEFRPVERFALPGESKLLEVTIDAAKAITADQKLCVQQGYVF